MTVSDNVGFIAGGGMVAIMAAYDTVVGVDYFKTGYHRLVVGDTLGIGTAHYTHHCIGQNNGTLLNYLIVADNVDNGGRSHECHAVQHLLGEGDIGNLYDTFGSELVAVKVVANCQLVGEAFHPKYLDAFEQLVGRNVVHYGAVAQGCYCERCLVGCHYIGFKPLIVGGYV